MVNVKLGDKTYEGVTAVKTDTTDGGTAEFAPYDETFAAGKAEGIEEGYANGKTDGYAEGKQVGIDEGVKTEYDRFWDAFQKNGQQTYYAYAFASFGWNQDTFYPKYDMAPTSAAFMFWNSYIQNLAQRLRDCGVVLDTSKATNLSTFAAGSSISVAPELSFVSAVNTDNVFGYCAALEKIEKIILGEDGNLTFTNWFINCPKLATVTFEGVIGQDINFSWSPLSATSLNSVITHLSDTATGKTATFMRSAVNTAFETAAGAADGATSQAWLALVATKPNWTISLV